MNAIITKPFRSGNSEAIRLPKSMAFGTDTEVEIARHGGVVTIRAKPKQTVAELLTKLIEMPGPGEVQKRDVIEFPERPGL